MVRPAGAAYLCLLGLRALLRPAVGMALLVLVHVLLTVVQLGTYVVGPVAAVLAVVALPRRYPPSYLRATREHGSMA
ncbi:hypothetical protein [Streptomyces virginiae]|uniref:hypothetical protein n=1 Tax=Streptomyces virginiae TaxID=1961 RepID=UPI003658E772